MNNKTEHKQYDDLSSKIANKNFPKPSDQDLLEIVKNLDGESGKKSWEVVKNYRQNEEGE